MFQVAKITPEPGFPPEDVNKDQQMKIEEDPEV